MKTLELENLGLSELKSEEVKELNGGFFPVVIFGIYLSAKAVGAIIVGAGLVGVATGAYVASQE